MTREEAAEALAALKSAIATLERTLARFRAEVDRLTAAEVVELVDQADGTHAA